MKTFAVVLMWVCMAGAVAPAAELASDLQQEAAVEVQYTAEQRLAYAKYVAALSEAALHLEAVADKESADAAAPAVAAVVALAAAYGELLDDSLQAEAVRQSGWNQDVVDALPSVYYYGSAALAQACGQTAEEAEEPAAPPESLLHGLRAQLESLSAEVLQRAGLSGGPGCTRDSAWLPVTATDTIADETCAVLLAAWEGYSPSILKENLVADADNNKFYAVLSIVVRVEDKRYLLEQWFDVSEAFSETARLQAMQQMAQLQARMNTILEGVKDKSGADAAAELLADMIETFTRCENVVAAMSETEYEKAAADSGYTEALEKSDAVLLRLEELGFFGSESLSEMFYW